MSGREGASVSLLPVPGPARGLPRRPTGQLDEWAHSTIQTEHLLCARPQAGPRPDGTRPAVGRGSTDKGTKTGRGVLAEQEGASCGVGGLSHRGGTGGHRSRHQGQGNGPWGQKTLPEPEPGHEAASFVWEPQSVRTHPQHAQVAAVSERPQRNSYRPPTLWAGTLALEAPPTQFGTAHFLFLGEAPGGPTLHSMMANQEWRPSSGLCEGNTESQDVTGRVPSRSDARMLEAGDQWITLWWCPTRSPPHGCETQASAPSMKWVHISPRAEFAH